MGNERQPKPLEDGIAFSDITADKQADDDRDEARTYCGWFSWRPDCLRCFASPRWLLFIISAYLFFQGMAVNGFVDGSLASLQRRFELSSFQTGLLPAMYDVVAAVLGVFLAYAGNKRNKARMLTVGTLCLGVGNLVHALPHFTTGLYSYSVDNTTSTCSLTEGNIQTSPADDEASISALSGYLWVFILAEILFSVGGSMGYTIGFAFVDESVSTENAGMYLGILWVCSTLGPALGLVIVGLLLSVYTDFHTGTGSVGIGASQWVGAWWLGFLFTAIASFIIAIPLSCFPHELPGTQTVRAQRESQAHAKSDRSGKASQKEFGKAWRDFPSALRIMVRNPTFMAVAVGLAADNLLMTGFGTFLPIYLEEQYGLSSGIANIIVGGLICTAGCGALFVGGWLIKRLRLKVLGMLKFVMGTLTANALLTLTLFLTCPEIPLAGVYQHYANDSAVSVVRLDDPCNDGCHCSTTPFAPVCGSNGVMYFSPCFAGCQSLEVGNETYSYADCTCVSVNSTSVDPTAVPGRCGITFCTQMYIFLVCLFFLIFATFLDRVASVNVILRCIPGGQQSFGLGINELIVRVFGSLPGPIIFGSIIDANCTLWHEEDGQRGRCWFHNRSDLALYAIIFSLAMKLTTLAFMFTAHKLYQPPKSVDETETGTENMVGLI
ncbi:solute carrier organic anion transporter family member 4A1-like [Patiria miniata]|uniref:Solute carrier organic anion transporter family member n=1 Tax=Patiria miniata TaxID=46514 RepID=A0A914AXZ3_PATMI|nr:solute carrier organic anion transporter family member 4A1-like [Patiria miniata]